jgi:hypothetical protein
MNMRLFTFTKKRWRRRIQYATHEGEGVAQMQQFLGIAPEDLVWPVEEVTLSSPVSVGKGRSGWWSRESG